MRRKLIVCTGALLAGFLASGMGRADVVLGLDDARVLPGGSEDPTVYAVGVPPYGFDPSSLTILSGPSFPEQFSLHGEYASSQVLAAGQTVAVNVNFIDPGGPAQPFYSDTLTITFTGQTPTTSDPINVSVDLHFRSDNGTSLPPLANAVNVNEVVGFMPMDAIIVAGGGPSDFHLSIQSAIPEPGPLALATVVVAMFAAGSLWKRL
jgi:hypothetical protein